MTLTELPVYAAYHLLRKLLFVLLGTMSTRRHGFALETYDIAFETVTYTIQLYYSHNLCQPLDQL